MAEETQKTLRDKIAEDNDFFKSLVNLIPGRVHFSQESKDELQLESASDLSEVDEDSTEDKRRSKKSERKQQKKKMRMSDPLENKTVTQLQEDLDNKLAAKGRKKKKKLKEFQPAPVNSYPSSLEELREKLHRRIEELKGKRGHLNPEEWLEKKKLKRKESKLKLKMRRKKEKLNPVKGDHHERSLPNGLTTSPPKPVYNKDGKIVFSKFDFTDSGKSKKKGLSDLTGKDYKKILENLEKRKDKIKKAQQTDVLAGRDLQKKSSWEMAIGKAEGVKIKDDPTLLKKAIKRKEKRKEKTKKNWEDRNKNVEDKKQARQDKRQKNIDLRKQTKLKTKLKKAGKKGRIIPGF